MAIISRTDIAARLRAWAEGNSAAADIHIWAVEQERDPTTDYDDWERGDAFSISKEAVAELAMLDMNLLTPEDVPAFMALLQAAPGEFEKAYIAFVGALQAIDREARSRALSGQAPYARYCE